MTSRYIYPLSTRWLPKNCGSKAMNLHFLLCHHFKVPKGWVIRWTAFEGDPKEKSVAEAKLRAELNRIINPRKLYAVRSSASEEDAGDFSCAGLFRSYLHIQGVDEMLRHVRMVCDSVHSAEYLEYEKEILKEKGTAKMAVIIQEMVPAVSSGVVFTKNPVTGMSETIIEAGVGTGEDQIGEGRNPERWVSKWGNWIEKPAQGFLDEKLVREIVSQSAAISRAYGKPADMEWAWDGMELSFLQIRPITRLDIPIFSNRISREMLPGLIKPLVWSVNQRLINPTWTDILYRLTGENSIKPEELTGHYYYRAYFNMGIFGRVFDRLGMPAEALELLFGMEQDGPDKPHMKPGMGILPRMPRMLFFTIRLGGIHGRLHRLTERKKSRYESLAVKMDQNEDPSVWLQFAHEIFEETKEVTYYNIMVPMLAMMHHRMLTGLLKKHGVDIRSLVLEGAAEAAAKYNPLSTLASLHDKYFAQFPEVLKKDAVLPPAIEAELQQEIKIFLGEFGHFSDSGNDCSSIPWRETPELIRRMIARAGISGGGSTEMMTFQDLKIQGIQRLVVAMLYRRTSRFAVSREEISSLYTYGYGQFRTCFLRLGTHLASRGIINNREDIFYLYWDELAELIESNKQVSMESLVDTRRKDMEQYAGAVVPEIILGYAQPPLDLQSSGVLKGIPTSIGTYQGPARVVKGIMDFDRAMDGDVLIIPFSDVGWIPLFAKAGAVVAESGGVLSHSSIVAREYRIPAVVSVSGACGIEEGVQVSVNGYTGEIALLEER